MAEVNTGGGDNKGKKVKQKKVSLRVDFTPMVDMNMLLITFFMFCTSLSKPQTMEINMPSRDKVNTDQGTEVKASKAVTVVMGGEDRVFYYFGLLDENAYKDPNFLVETNYGETGLRAMLLSRNADVNRKIQALKARKINENMSEEEFKKQSIDIKGDKEVPVIMIKAMPDAVYKNLIDVLDEMQICNVGKYAIVDIQDGDMYLVNKYLGLLPDDAATR